MRWSYFALAGLMSLSAAAPMASADQDYAVLIISRERLEVLTNCEIGLYIQDQLAGRLYQEQATSFNLPAGKLNDVACSWNSLPASWSFRYRPISQLVGTSRRSREMINTA